MNQKKKKKIGGDIIGLLIVIVVLTIFMCIFAQGFRTWYNIHNLLKDISILLMVASGMTIAILLGKIDMSAGSVMSLAAVVVALVLQAGLPFVVAIAAGIACGVIIGLINGYLIGVQNLNHFIATLATMNIAKGAALVACNGQIIPSKSTALLFVGTGKILGLFFIVWFTAIVFAFMCFVMKKTRLGYEIYSVGGSEQVARLSGINTTRVYIVSFMIAGAMAAIGGIFMAGKANSGNATMGDGYEFNAIATVLIGGTPFDGGKGNLLGTLAGAVFISILKNGIALLGLTPAWQYLIIGLVILGAIILDVALNEKKNAEEKRRVEQ